MAKYILRGFDFSSQSGGWNFTDLPVTDSIKRRAAVDPAHNMYSAVANDLSQFTLADTGSLGEIPLTATIQLIQLNCDWESFGPFGKFAIDSVVNGAAFGGAGTGLAQVNLATNPSTGSAWTRSELFSTLFGIKITSGTGGGFKLYGYSFYIVIKYTVPGGLVLTPDTGSTAGGTAVTLSGASGLGLTDSLGGWPLISIDGNSATSVTILTNTSVSFSTPAGTAGLKDVFVVGVNPTGYQVYFDGSGSDGFTYVAPAWWELDLPGVTYYEYGTQPTDFVMPNSVFYNGINYPAGTVVEWVAGATPTDTGWWLSIDEDFAGNAFVVNQSRPKAPRSYEDIETFATSTAGWLGGSPGPSCVWNNHMVYAEGNYTVGTTAPAIRIFDGSFDREVVALPNTTAGVVPIGIMSMIAANGTIYLSTLDSGSSSADWSGRVFSLDIESGQLTPIGTAFPAGHVPYALAWHAGRLWCGTNRQVSTAVGKVYFFRPDIDTTWTDDYTLSSSSVAGVSSMLSYKGKLYVGTTNAAASFAKVLVRSELGVYTTSKTASGGTAAANNGILAMAEYSGNLYASFWNPDSPTAVSLIYKFDNSSWTTAFTGATTTLVPFVSLPVDLSAILAVSGGITYSAVVLSSASGTSWSDKTAFLSQGTPNSTGLNVFGILAL